MNVLPVLEVPELNADVWGSQLGHRCLEGKALPTAGISFKFGFHLGKLLSHPSSIQKHIGWSWPDITGVSKNCCLVEEMQGVVSSLPGGEL